MKKRFDNDQKAVTSLIGLGNHSTRKSYYPELVSKLDELEEEKNRYKWLFENALHGIFQFQLDGKIINANPAIVQMCGYASLGHFLGANLNIKTNLFSEPESYLTFRDELIKNGKIRAYETSFRRAGCEPISIAISAILKKEDNDSLLVEAFVQDITERKKAQNKLKLLNEELEDRVHSRTQELLALNDKLWLEIRDREQAQKELKVAKEAAEEANKSKDKYLAAASHDLLQPMNAARLLIAALRERSLLPDDANLVERVHLALENAEELLTDLLDISKLDQQAVKPDISEFNLNQIFASLSAEFLPVAENKGLLLKTLHSNAAVRSDSRLLVRIIRNLISNAIRYTDTGRVLLGCRRKRDSIVIEVWDTGTGIPQDKIDQIFEEFQQLECHNGRSRQGVGLGLAIVDRISRILEHPIQVRSEAGKGSVFSVEVPVAKNLKSNTLKRGFNAPAPDLLNNLCILVIDNEENILVSMKALLEQWGCRVITSSTAEEALQNCIEAKLVPEIILADFHLDNNQRGTDAIMELRDSLGMDIPAAMLTADRSVECRELFKQMGLPVLNKPVKPGKLRSLLTFLT